MWADIQTNIHTHPVEAQWHGDLDEYGSFCLTIPLEQIAVIVTELCVINNRWDFQVESNPSALRDLDVWQAI